MTLSELKRKLSQHGSIDVDGLYAQYREDGATNESGGATDVNDFVRYLRDRGVIDARILAELHSAHPLEATFIMAGNEPPPGADPPAAEKAPAAAAAPPAVDDEDDDEDPARYDVLQLLGKGAMGEVHVAKDVVLHRKVAFKSILPKMAQNQQVVDRFLGEMRITSQLDHPYVVPVYGVEVTDDGSIAYAMKLVKGKELADLLAESKQAVEAGAALDQDHSLEGRLEVFLKVCDAMSFAHDRGIVHRDLKPANIMIGEHKEVYVMDWGIARPMGSAGAAADQGLELYDGDEEGQDTQRTRLGQALGTPIYMSPEQAAGKNEELDGRSDLYTLGLILQEVLTLERAVGGTTLAEVLTNAKAGKREAPRPIERTASGVRELEAIIAKATQLSPAHRYASVDDFAQDIRRYLRNEAVSVLPDGPVRKLGRWVSKHRMASLSIMLTFLLAGAGGVIGLLAHNRAQAAQRHTRELRLSELQTESAIQAHEVDKKLQRYESGLAQIVGAAQVVLDHPASNDRATFVESDFAGGTTVPDLAPSKYYGKPISTASAAFALAPNIPRSEAEPMLRALSVLEPALSEIAIESATSGAQPVAPAQRRTLIAERGVPVHRVFLSLTAGVRMGYPGMHAFADDRPANELGDFYATVQAKGLHWEKPRKSKAFDGLVMTCSAPLYDEAGRFRGVAGIDVSVDRLGEDVGMDLTYVTLAALVTRDGEVMSSTGTGTARDLADVLALPDVSKAMEAGTGGHATAILGGEQVLVTYYPLHSVQWYFVTVANVASMLGSEPKAEPRTPWVGAAPSERPAAPPPPPPAPAPAAPADAGAGGEEPGDAGAGGEPPVAPPTPPPSGLPWPNAKPPPQPSAQPPPPSASAIPKNPFDKWDVYKK